MDAACIRKLARKGDVARVIEIFNVVGRVEAFDFFE
jgi:hypothetical protein